MRVPRPNKPNNTARFKKSWAVILLIVITGVIGTALFGRRSSPNIAAPVASFNQTKTSHIDGSTMVSVVVAARAIDVGDPLDGGAVTTDLRRADTLPADAVTSAEELTGHVAFGPIAARAPLTRAQLGTSVAVFHQRDYAQGDPAVLEEMLRSLSRRLVQLDLTFGNQAPLRGTRLAVLCIVNGKQQLAIEEAWSLTSSDHHGTVLARPDEAAIIKECPADAVVWALPLRAGDSARVLLGSNPVPAIR